LRQIKVTPPKRSHACADRGREVASRLRLVNDIAQNLTGFFLHGATMLRRTDTQTSFHIIIEVADCNTGHAALLFIMKIASDCIAIKSL
jgi:hypothetical protein